MRIPAPSLAVRLALPLLIGAAACASAASTRTVAEADPAAAKTDLSRQDALRSADWVRDAVLYEVYLRSFSLDEKIYRLDDRLQALKNLGINCIWLMPIQPIGEIKRKGKFGSPYSVKDYGGVNLEYGTKDMAKGLVDDAHQIGMKVILDWVADRTAWDHPWIKDHPGWYERDARGAIVSPSTGEWDTAQLDYSKPDLRKAMIEAMLSWVKAVGVDGFRCDAADRIPDDFWAEARKALTAAKPDLLLLAGGERPSHHLASFDLTYFSGLYGTFRDIAAGKKDAQDIEETLESAEKAYPRGSLHLLFTEDHDTRRAADLFGPAARAFAVAAFTLQGVPSVYNGQEIGETHAPSLSDREPIDWKGGLRKHRELRKFYKRLLKLRASHPSITRGQRFPLAAGGGRRVLAYAQSYREDAVLVAVNCSSEPYRGSLEVPDIFLDAKGGLAAEPVFDGDGLKVKKGGKPVLELPAWGYQVWEAK